MTAKELDNLGYFGWLKIVFREFTRHTCEQLTGLGELLESAVVFILLAILWVLLPVFIPFAAWNRRRVWHKNRAGLTNRRNPTHIGQQ